VAEEEDGCPDRLYHGENVFDLFRDGTWRAAAGIPLEIESILTPMKPDDPVSPRQPGRDPSVALAGVHSRVKDENDSPFSLDLCANGCTVRRRGEPQIVFTCVTFAILHRNNLLINDKWHLMI
jgi:hypothetical protein